MNKMGLFIQPPGAGMDLIARYKPAAVLLMGATAQHIREARDASPETDILVWWHEDWRGWQTTDPGQWADHIAAGIKDCKPDAVAFWNENLSHDHHFLFADYDARQAAYIDRMQDHYGIPVGGFAMGEGNFTKDGPNLVECFPKSLARLQYIFIHEYWFPRIRSPGMEGYHCLRWPYWLEWLDAAGLGHIQIYVTECGLTSLINGAGPDEGWLGETAKTYGVTDEAYFDDVAYYHARCCAEPRVKAMIPFLALSYPGQWETFRLTRNPALLDRLMALDAPGSLPGPIPEPPEPAPEPPEPAPGDATMTIEVIDDKGQTLSPESATEYLARYGIKYREPAGLHEGDWYWKLIRLAFKPTASWIFTVLDENGKPVEGQQTAFGWYEMDDEANQVGGNPYATDWYKYAVLGPTNVNGNCGHAMTTKWYHDEFEPGPGYGWVRDPVRPSTVVEDIGMLGGTDHWTLVGIWQLQKYGGPPLPPEPPPPEPPPQEGWTMREEWFPAPGLRLMIGHMADPGIAITVTDPWGNRFTTRSGDKADYGDGGWELTFTHPGLCSVDFLDQRFWVQVDNNTAVHLYFQEGPAPPPMAYLISGSMEMEEAKALLKRLRAAGFDDFALEVEG